MCHHFTVCVPNTNGRAISNRKCHICICVSVRDLLLIAPLCDAALLFVPVFQLQCAADAAGLLGVPADQQHREAGPHAAHPAHLPAAGGVATSSTIRQRRPLCHLQCHVSATGWVLMRSGGTE